MSCVLPVHIHQIALQMTKYVPALTEDLKCSSRPGASRRGGSQAFEQHGIVSVVVQAAPIDIVSDAVRGRAQELRDGRYERLKVGQWYLLFSLVGCELE